VQQISQDISETSGQSGFTSPLLMGLVAATAFSGVMSLAATTVSMYTTESRVAASDNRKSLLEMVKSNFTKGKDKGKTIYSQWKTNTNLKIQHAIISNHTVPVIQALVGELGNCVQQMPEMNPYHGRLGECLHLRGSTEKMSPSKIITNKKNLEPVCKVEYQEPEDEDIAEAFRDQLMPSGVEMGPRLSLRGRPLHALPAAVAAPRAASVPVGRPILRAAPYYYRLPGPYRYPSDAPVGLPFAAPHSAPVSRRRASSHDAPHSAPVSRRRASSHDAPFGLPVKRPRNAEKLPLMRQLDMPDDGLKRKSKQLKSGKRRKIQTKKI
jgi:hypothetical protein